MKTVEKWQWIVTDKYNRQFLTEYFLTEESASKKSLDTNEKCIKAEWTRIVVECK